MKTYEGMFLLDAGQSNFEEACQPIRNIMARHSAECLQMKKWDERRLAYEIAGRRRGLYVLCYFKADPQEISGMERDVQLSEEILRVMILSADHVAQDKMDAPTPSEADAARQSEEKAAQAEAPTEQAPEEAPAAVAAEETAAPAEAASSDVSEETKDE